jgi:hypothetical protein
MKMSATTLLNELTMMTTRHLAEVRRWRQLPMEQLNARPAADAWSALECFEHLNLYGDYYLPAMQQQMKKQHLPPRHIFRSGLLGNYFANSMLPKAKLNKMKTFQNMNPAGSQLDAGALERFIQQQELLLQILEQARNTDIGRIKIPITLSKWIRLKLGDTLRFVIYHHERHMQQAQRALNLRP